MPFKYSKVTFFQLLLPVLFILIFSCRKVDILSSDHGLKLRISSPQISFDTVFTRINSTLRTVSLHNDNQEAVEISSIRLKGNLAGNSFYSFSAGGKPGPLVRNLKLSGGDSITLYIKVQIPANELIMPFIEQDSILITTNGNNQGIALKSYGQNVRFINDTLISSDTHWNAIYPYVINHTLTVANGATLRIDAGSRIYFHGLTGLNINGSLIVNGEVKFPVIFNSDRLESIYNSVTGQWRGILIEPGGNTSLINYSQIMNAETGIAILSAQPIMSLQATISNTQIDNMSVDGIYCQNTAVKLLNNVVSYCQNSLLEVTGDSYVQAKQNTFYNSNQLYLHTVPSVSLILSGSADSILFLNNIIYGTLTDELFISGARKVILKGNLLSSTLGTTYPLNSYNADPLFRLPSENDLHLQSTKSPATSKGVSLVNDPDFRILLKDFDSVDRRDPPTIGAYEVY